MKRQHHLDRLDADRFVEQFVNRGLPFQLAGTDPIHASTICAPVCGERLDTRFGLWEYGVGDYGDPGAVGAPAI